MHVLFIFLQLFIQAMTDGFQSIFPLELEIHSVVQLGLQLTLQPMFSSHSCLSLWPCLLLVKIIGVGVSNNIHSRVAFRNIHLGQCSQTACFFFFRLGSKNLSSSSSLRPDGGGVHPTVSLILLSLQSSLLTDVIPHRKKLWSPDMCMITIQFFPV